MEINDKRTELKKVLTNSSTMPGRPPPLNPTWISAIFTKMQARYGCKWTSSYPPGSVLTAALDEWATELSGFTGEEITTGFKNLDPKWPPSLGEFKEACRPPAPPACHKDFPRIGKPAVDREAAQHHIDTAKAILRKPR